MFNPESEKDLKRLREAMAWSAGKYEVFCKKNMEAVQQFAGFHYGENHSEDKVPINLIALGVKIFRSRVASGMPQALVTTMHRELEAEAYENQLATNYQLEKINLGEKMRSAFVYALLGGPGVVKCGLVAEEAPSTEESFYLAPSRFFCEPVLMDDFIIDMRAKRRDQVAYMGNRFRVPLDWAKENRGYKKAVREKLMASDDRSSAEHGSSSENETRTISQGQGPVVDEYQDYVDLVELWLPQEGLVVTMEDGAEKMPLRVVEWEGPDHGPFHILSLEDIPGNVIPQAPVGLWRDLHEITNRLFNKASRQAERQKTWTAVPGHAKDDGSRVVGVADGEAIYVESPGDIKEISSGGANQQTLAMVIWSKQMLTYMGGNWDAIGGLAAQSETVGQDKLLAGSASETVQEMQRAMLTFTRGVVTDAAYYTYTDPLIDLPLSKPIQGTPYSIPFRYTPERRKGDFFCYNFDVDPYSLVSRSPMDRAKIMTDFVMQIVVPLIPAITQQGMSVNWERFFKLFTRYMSEPEINDLIIYAQGEAMKQPGPEEPGMPTSTTRNYVRENKPAGTRQGQDAAMMSLLMGGNPQSSEMAGLARPAS